MIRVSLFHSNGVDITKARIIINEKHNQKNWRRSKGKAVEFGHFSRSKPNKKFANADLKFMRKSQPLHEMKNIKYFELQSFNFGPKTWSRMSGKLLTKSMLLVVVFILQNILFLVTLKPEEVKTNVFIIKR